MYKKTLDRTEIHILDGKSKFQNFILERTLPLSNINDYWDFTTSKYDNDSKEDLYCINKNGTSNTELTVLAAKSNFQETCFNRQMPMESVNKSRNNVYNSFLAWGDNLYAVKPSGGTNTEIHSMQVKSNVTRRALILGETTSPVVPERDVTSMVDMFNNNIFNGAKISVSSYQNKSKEFITSTIKNTFANASDSDVSYIYMTCHGGQNGEIFIGTGNNNYYTGSELKGILDTIKGKVVLMLDCCHSGNIINKDYYILNSSKFYSDFKDKQSGQLCSSKYKVICSSSKTQKSRGGSLSLATEYWEKAAGWDLEKNCATILNADTNNDSYVTLNELYQYSHRNVSGQTVVCYPENDNFILFANKK